MERYPVYRYQTFDETTIIGLSEVVDLLLASLHTILILIERDRDFIDHGGLNDALLPLRQLERIYASR